jgi:3-hydroxyacyl-CoA dehydrogenase
MNENIAVIGGGQMGSQIAALAAMAGYKTSIYDSNEEYLNEKIKFTRENILNLIDKGKYNQTHLENFDNNLKIFNSLEDTVENKTFVIEAVVEKFDVKLDIFKKIISNIRCKCSSCN